MRAPEAVAVPATAATPLPFRLWRFFSLASLVGVLVVTAVLFLAFRQVAVDLLVDHEGRANADLTRVFANSVWGGYREFMAASAGRTREEVRALPQQAQLRADVLERMRGLRIVKVKVYNRDGLTVFSTEDRQIGEDKRDNEGFRRALAGEVASLITFRERFDTFEGVLSNRNLISSYVPIRQEPGAPVEGVFEVYSDVTEMLQQRVRAQWQVAGIVLGMLALLYLFLAVVVRRADRVITAQEADRSLREEQARHLAMHDPLTGLPNRAHFGQRLPEVLGLAQRHGHVCALMVLDLDHFKAINDSLGHDAGDRLLRHAGQAMQQVLRGSDTLFRLGGDEFTVLLPEVSAAEDVAVVARRLQEALARPLRLDGSELVAGASIGIAVYPGDGDDSAALMKNADAAMYAAKEAGRGGYAFYSDAMNQRAVQRLRLEAALRRAQADGQLLLYYQPRLAAGSGTPVAMEALLRWNHPTRGVLAASEFVDVLEDSGMMPAVGEWVLRSACAQWVQWRAQGLKAVRMAVNVSSRQFLAPAFEATVQRALSEHGMPAAQLELELGEALLTGASVRNALVEQRVAALRAMGVRVAVDESGFGNSLLGRLRAMQVDGLKVDRRLLGDTAHNERDRALAIAVGEMARALGIAVAAVGVETDEQARFFSDIGCTELQGHHFARAAPASQAQAALGA